MTTTTNIDAKGRVATGLMIRRVIQLLIGLYLYGVGIAFLIRSELGAASWDVLTQGISRNVPWSFGTISVLVGGIVLLLWIPLRQRPGIGTVLNALLVGPAVDVSFPLIPVTDNLWVRLAYIGLGIVGVGLATGLYIGSRFGPGPRDGLMTGLHRATGLPIWRVRVAIELVVVAIGWTLGGTVGIGTIAFAIFIGSVCQYFMRIFRIALPGDADQNVVATIAETQANSGMQESPA